MTDEYCAVGFSYKNDIWDCDHVGEIHSMKEWILLLFGDRGIDFFDGFSDKAICDYVKNNVGYRLSRCRKKGENEWAIC